MAQYAHSVEQYSLNQKKWDLFVSDAEEFEKYQYGYLIKLNFVGNSM